MAVDRRSGAAAVDDLGCCDLEVLPCSGGRFWPRSGVLRTESLLLALTN